MSTNEDVLYSWLNARGRKSFQPIDRAQLVEKFPEYGKIGLPAHKAALDGNIEALQDVYTAFNADGVPSRDVNGATPLHLAVRSNRTETVKWLLRFTDLSPTTAAKHGETPCHVAAVLGNIECFKAMLGADVKGEICVTSDNSGFTALHLAIVKSRNEVAKLLISELGVKGMGIVNESGITAAHVAASAGNMEILKIILNKNKKLLSQRTTDGTTPLYFAAQEGRLAAVKFLHEKGKCDLTTPSNDGRIPIHAACLCGHTHIVKYIVSQLNNSVIFETVPDGATTLHFAASTGQVNTSKWLIDSDMGGTLISSKDNSGDTPAHDAADNGQTATLKLLLESGADLYAINNDGNTPYSLALSNEQEGMADFVMAFASNAPQKQEGPSQMTIFDMQGELDVVDLPQKDQVIVEAEVQQVQEEGRGEDVKEQEETTNKKDDKKSKKREKEKKEKKQKDKKGKRKSSNSFSGSPGAALLSMPSDTNNESSKPEGDDKVLDMTEEELDMFKEDRKADENTTQRVPASTDDSDIVVSYGDSTPPVKSKLSQSGPMATTDYSTIAEIERAEQRKDKKRVRKNSKSIQKQKHDKDSSKNVEGAGAILSGPQMGFKPQFHSNPLQRLSGLPPTPPPTPATGISSSATSEAALISTTEDEDDMPYDVYIEDGRPPYDEEGSVEKEKNHGKKTEGKDRVIEKEDNILTNLDDEEEEEEEDDEYDNKPVLKKWPPPKSVDYKPADAKIQPSGVNVLKKWQPTSEPVPSPIPGKPTTGKEISHGNVLKKWPPAASSEPTTKEPITRLIAKTTSSSPPLIHSSPSPSQDAERERKAVVQLRPVQKTMEKNQPQVHNVDQNKELGNIKLKKTTKTATASNYSSPSSESTSGADNELTALLKLRQGKI